MSRKDTPSTAAVATGGNILLKLELDAILAKHALECAQVQYTHALAALRQYHNFQPSQPSSPPSHSAAASSCSSSSVRDFKTGDKVVVFHNHLLRAGTIVGMAVQSPAWRVEFKDHTADNVPLSDIHYLTKLFAPAAAVPFDIRTNLTKLIDPTPTATAASAPAAAAAAAATLLHEPLDDSELGSEPRFGNSGF